MIELGLISKEELIKELESRCDHIVLLMNRREGDANLYDFIFRGGRWAALGLAEQFVFDMKASDVQAYGDRDEE